MAPKRKSDDLPPQSSESVDEEHSTSSNDSDSTPQQLNQSKPQDPTEESRESEEFDESEEADESESDSDASSDKTQKPNSAVSPPASKPAQMKPNGKRAAETDEINEFVKGKKSKTGDEGSKAVKKGDKGSKSDGNVGKGLKSDKGKRVEKGSKRGEISNGGKKREIFKRVFPEKDEIVMLEGILEYKEKGLGGDSILSMAEFVEDSLSCNFTRGKIADKIRGLKKKYMNNAKKGKDGEDPVFSKPHEYKVFQLSKKIWGSGVWGSGDSKVRGSKKTKKKDDNVASQTAVGNEAEAEDCWSLYPCLCASLESEMIKKIEGPVNPKEYVKKVVSGIEKVKAKELEQEWKGLVIFEQRVYAKRMNVIAKQAEALVEALHPQNH